ncbi:MAG: HEAT repeat domain-containing protein [Anaerolineae bacterium]
MLAQIRNGALPRDTLHGLSSLTGDDAEKVREVWPELPVEIRREIITVLVEISECDFKVYFGEVFRIALEDPDAVVREAAVKGLQEEEDVRLISLLASYLQEDPSPEVRAAAAISLGHYMLLGELGEIQPRSHRRVYQALITGCTSTEERAEVRCRALESLAYSGEEEIVALIDKAYQDPDERMQISAVLAMGRSADKQWAPVVLGELLSPNPQMRCEAARACGKLALEEAISTLIERVDDVDTEVQDAAIWALGQIGGEEARRVLKSCMRAGRESKREAAREALRELEFLHGDLSAILFPFDLDVEDTE